MANYNVWSVEQVRSRRKQMSVEEDIPYTIGGEQKTVTKEMKQGNLLVPELSRPLGELLATDEELEEMMEKVVLDVELGRERVPTVYEPIYERIEDRNFPRVFDAKWAVEGLVVFLEYMEGSEIKMGTMAAHEGPIARIQTWAAGFEYTEDMIEYDHTFEVEELNRAFGEAYNALLNHIHLYPIISASYDSDHTTNSSDVATDDDPWQLQIKQTLRQAMRDANLERRPGSVLLTSRYMEGEIEEALDTMVIDGTEYPSVGGIDDIIYYDGWDTKVGKKEYSYSGVSEDIAYLIRPRRGFKELVKHGLIIDAQPGKLKRLIEEAIVGRTRRGVFAAIDENVQKIDLTEQTS